MATPPPTYVKGVDKNTGQSFEYDPGQISSYSPGVEEQLRNYLRMPAGRKPNLVQHTVDMLRGLTNSVVPGLAINSELQPDLYNPFTGHGRDPELNTSADADAGKLEQISNIGQIMASAGGKGLFTKAAKAGVDASRTGAELLFKNKIWDALPEAFKSDPKFIQEAIQHYRAINEGTKTPRGIAKLPGLVTGVADEAKTLAGRTGEKAAGVIKSLSGKFTDNPLAAKAAMAGPMAGLSMVNDARGQIAAEQAKNVTPTDNSDANPDVGVVPTTYSDEPAQFTGVEPTPPTPEEKLRAILAGNKGLTPYVPPEKHGLGKIIDSISKNLSPGSYYPQEQEAAARDYQNQITQKNYLDPNTEEQLKQFEAQQGADLGVQTHQRLKSSAQEFGQRYAPSMDPGALEQLYGLPSGSIDPVRLQKTGLPNDPSASIMQMLQALQSNGGPQQIAVPGQTAIQPTQRTVNPPIQRH